MRPQTDTENGLTQLLLGWRRQYAVIRYLITHGARVKHNNKYHEI